MKLSEALGYPMHYNHPSGESWMRSARLTPDFTGVSYEKLNQVNSVQWPCNEKATGRHSDHATSEGFVCGKGRFMLTEFIPTEERVTRRFPLILTTGRILTQYNAWAPRPREPETTSGIRRTFLRSIPRTREDRGIKEGDLVALTSRAGETSLKARISERMQPGVVYTTFHHMFTGANVVTTEFSDWATGCPEYKVTAVQVSLARKLSEWQQHYPRHAKANHPGGKRGRRGQISPVRLP